MKVDLEIRTLRGVTVKCLEGEIEPVPMGCILRLSEVVIIDPDCEVFIEPTMEG